jgi:hypothetical protein
MTSPMAHSTETYGRPSRLSIRQAAARSATIAGCAAPSARPLRSIEQ